MKSRFSTALIWHGGAETYLTQLMGAFFVLAIGGITAWLAHGY